MSVKISDLPQIATSLDLMTRFEVEDNAGNSYHSNLAQISSQLSIPESTSDIINDSGFITGITSIDVSNALGFTPLDQTLSFSGNFADLRCLCPSPLKWASFKV